MLVGDITEGQDADFTDQLPQVRRSGVARKALLTNIAFTTTTYVWTQTLSREIVLVNFSATQGGDPDCDGMDSWSVMANDLFEAGVGVFKSAGNEYSADPDECDVSTPGSAIGVMAIAGEKVDDVTDTEMIYSASSKGGTSVEGRDRKIIALTTPTAFQYAYPHFAWPIDLNNDEYHYGTNWGGVQADPGNFCCTSSAAPVATGSAAIYREFIENTYGTGIHDPGRLYTAMLLWSDRFNGSTYLTSEFDNRWGAGRLRLRQPDSVGLDGPMSFSGGDTCVDSGTAVDIPITSGTLSGDVDVMRAVTWWYDRRHDGGTHHDTIDLKLQERVPNGNGTDVRVSDDPDNRQRVFATNPDLESTKEYRIRLVPVSVTADNEGCGTDSMRVYYAYFYEDSDREAAEDLDNVRPK